MASALAECAAAACMYWAQPYRRDPEAIRGSVAGLSDVERAEVVELLESGYARGSDDGQLLTRMIELATKAWSRDA